MCKISKVLLLLNFLFTAPLTLSADAISSGPSVTLSGTCSAAGIIDTNCSSSAGPTGSQYGADGTIRLSYSTNQYSASGHLDAWKQASGYDPLEAFDISIPVLSSWGNVKLTGWANGYNDTGSQWCCLTVSDGTHRYGLGITYSYDPQTILIPHAPGTSETLDITGAASAWLNGGNSSMDFSFSVVDPPYGGLGGGSDAAPEPEGVFLTLSGVLLVALRFVSKKTL